MNIASTFSFPILSQLFGLSSPLLSSCSRLPQHELGRSNNEAGMKQCGEKGPLQPGMAVHEDSFNRMWSVWPAVFGA